jgi:hypothetical protein
MPQLTSGDAAVRVQIYLKGGAIIDTEVESIGIDRDRSEGFRGVVYKNKEGGPQIQYLNSEEVAAIITARETQGG